MFFKEIMFLVSYLSILVIFSFFFFFSKKESLNELIFNGRSIGTSFVFLSNLFKT
ncbi:Hypothetical protein MLEA_006900 [Mycoplasma leachii 99/014/6]|nr:Hypothetical protein MLEA_006900 [Mycoplasma leachii 99/014/6]